MLVVVVAVCPGMKRFSVALVNGVDRELSVEILGCILVKLIKDG